MVNVSSMFLVQESVDGYLAARKAAPAADRRGHASSTRTTRKSATPRSRSCGTRSRYPDADWKVAVDHIERVLKLGGPGAAGLGTDFDGITDPPAGLEDVSKLPKLTEELLRRGHSEEVVRGVLGENFLRFWDQGRGRAKAMAPPRTGPLAVLEAR